MYRGDIDDVYPRHRRCLEELIFRPRLSDEIFLGKTFVYLKGKGMGITRRERRFGQKLVLAET